MRGGYIEINLNGLNITSNMDIIVSGIYDKFVKAFNLNKRIVISNYSINGTKCSPTIIELREFAMSFEFYLIDGITIITVALDWQDNVVTNEF